MNKTLSFAKLDYITIKPYMTIKNLAIIILVMGYMGYILGQQSVIGFVMMYGVIYASYPFAVGDKNGIDTLYTTMPLGKKNIVIGRYIFALSLNMLFGVLALVLSGVISMFLGKGVNWKEELLTILVCFIFCSIVTAIQLPIYFKLGYAKARTVALLPLIGIPGFAVIAAKLIGKDKLLPFIQNVSVWAETNKFLAIAGAIGIWGGMMAFTIWLSYCFYKKREF